jgi:hypothetical protein
MSRKNESEEVPNFFISLTKHLIEYSPSQKGVFRENGEKNDVLSLIDKLNSNENLNFKDFEITTLTSLYKQFFRELPEPLLTFKEYKNFINVNTINKQDEKIKALNSIFKNIHIHYRNLFYYLLMLLKIICEKQKINMMNEGKIFLIFLENLAVVFAPNILREVNQSDFSKIQDANKVVTFMIATFPKYLINLEDFENFSKKYNLNYN